MSSADAPSSFKFDPCWRWVLYLMVEKVTASFIYAFMITLLAIATLTMKKRRRLKQTNIILAAFYLMAILSTTQGCLDLADIALVMDFMRKFLETNPPASSCPVPPWLVGDKPTIYYAQWTVLALNMLIADGLFIYRCYLIWNNQFRIILLPMLLLAATVGSIFPATTGHLDLRVAISLGLATNMLLVALTVGRIISINTKFARQFGVKTIGTYQRTALWAVMQSSVLYAVTALLVLISVSIRDGDNFVYFFAIGATRHIVNIVPILAIVEAGLSQNQNPAARSRQQRIHVIRMPATSNLEAPKDSELEDAYASDDEPGLQTEKGPESLEEDIQSVSGETIV